MNAITEPHLFLPLLPRPVAEASPAVQAWIIPVAPQACAVFFDSPVSPSAGMVPGAARLTGTLDTRPLPRPVVSSSLSLCNGGQRYVMLIPLSAQAVADRHLRMSLSGHLAAWINPDWLQSPRRDLAALIEGLDQTGRHRLVKVFFTTAASLLGAAQSRAFEAVGRELVAMLQVPVLRAEALCPLGASGSLARFRLHPQQAGAAPVLVALSSERIERIKDPAVWVEPSGSWHLHVPELYAGGRIAAGRDILALLPEPFLLCLSDCTPQPMSSWLSGQPDAVRHWAETRVRKTAGADRMSQALVRELAEPLAPTVTIHHLSATVTGLLVWADIADPARLLAGIRIEAADSIIDLRLLPSGLIRAFVPVPWESDTGHQCRLRLVYRSGRIQTVHQAVVPMFDGSIAGGIAADDLGVAGQALAQARLTRLRPALHLRTETCGLPPRRPKLSLIVPVADNSDIMRARASCLTAEPGWHEVEVIYHCVASRAGAAHRLLAQISQTHGLAHQLLVVPDTADATEPILEALRQCRGSAALLLGAQVLPQGQGWLTPWMRALRPRRGLAMLAGTVLDPDGSIRHAGGRLGPAGLGHANYPDTPLVGMPEQELKRAALAPTELVTANCAALQREAIEIMCSLTLPYPNPDIVLTAALHRLPSAHQRARIKLRHRFVDYGPGHASGLDLAADAAALGLALQMR
jgi:hypothetical protein